MGAARFHLSSFIHSLLLGFKGVHATDQAEEAGEFQQMGCSLAWVSRLIRPARGTRRSGSGSSLDRFNPLRVHSLERGVRLSARAHVLPATPRG